MSEYSPYCDVTQVRELIACAWRKNIPFFAYRCPHEQLCHFGAQSQGNPVHGVAEGFRVVPFDTDGDSRPFTITPDIFPEDIDRLQSLPRREVVDISLDEGDVTYAQYLDVAQELIATMQRGEASKVVLSRSITRSCDMASRLPDYFARLCELYPSAYVFVVSYPGVCGWMGATPETLLVSSSQGYTAMALAGTRKANTLAEWGEKEREEQLYVEQYIADILAAKGLQQVAVDRLTRQAGPVEHLCTLFDITAPHGVALRDELVESLHPTPAVAGLPTEVAKRLIKEHELRDRAYYGGYVGETCNDGRCALYVNLRSMAFTAHASRLYVGGGLTARSVAEDEWNETCAKSQTLLSALE